MSAVSRGRVLLVDDDPLVLSALGRVLGAAGFETIRCDTAAAALGHFAHESIDVIVSDIAMPGLTGLDLLQAVRQWNLELPVILVTGTPERESAALAVELGALEYLLKPVSDEFLVRSVTRAVRLYRLGKTKAEALALAGGRSGRTSDGIGLAAALDHAVEHVWPAFQPILRAEDRSLYGYEAFLRSNDETLTDPKSILDAAERLGRISEPGRRLRELAVAHFERLGEGLQLFLNVHPLELLSGEFEDESSKVCAAAGHLVLEFTERTTLDGVKDVTERLERLRHLGYRIAIDDLGAGYAGLVSFVSLEPEFVKLDVSLLRAIDESPVKQRLVSSMASMCRDMGLLVVAEGIETEAERDSAVSLGVDLLQGYRFGRPSRALERPRW